jgi:hypothetical protein
MRDEKIVLRGDLVRADQIVLPDIRYWGLCLSMEEQELILFVHEAAQKVYSHILNRQKGKVHKEQFEIEIPHMLFIAGKFVSGIAKEIIDFGIKYHALVNHLLPEARKTSYQKALTASGVRYDGIGLVPND